MRGLVEVEVGRNWREAGLVSFTAEGSFIL